MMQLSVPNHQLRLIWFLLILNLSNSIVMQLSVPNHLLWLIWFYLVFHSLLNSIGEILQFADRYIQYNFYLYSIIYCTVAHKQFVKVFLYKICVSDLK